MGIFELNEASLYGFGFPMSSPTTPYLKKYSQFEVHLGTNKTKLLVIVTVCKLHGVLLSKFVLLCGYFCLHATVATGQKSLSFYMQCLLLLPY